MGSPKLIDEMKNNDRPDDEDNRRSEYNRSRNLAGHVTSSRLAKLER